jgi:aspartate-semialdehyde dehydrogenase
MEVDVPLVIAEVNPDHLALVEEQRAKGDGFVVANGNCTAIILALALKPLADAFGVRKCHLVSMQALSGAGYPGLSALDVVDNLIPFIPEEEGKVEAEVPKFLGRFAGDHVEAAKLEVSATCTRVPVLEGHTLAVSVELATQASEASLGNAFRSFTAEPQRLRLPSAPVPPIVYREEDDRPQPRRDRDAGHRMAVSVGRVRPDPLLGWKFVATGSNTVRGAAGASILNAELAVARGFIA